MSPEGEQRPKPPPVELTPELSALGAVLGALDAETVAKLALQAGYSMEDAQRAAAVITGAAPPPSDRIPLPLPDQLGGGTVVLSAAQLRALQAMEGSIDVDKSKTRLRAAKKGQGVADTVSGPEFRIDYTRVRQGPPVSFPVPIDSGTENVTVIPERMERLDISARQPIWDSGRKRLSKYLAARDRNAAQHGLVATSGQAALQGQEMAYDVLRSMELEGVAVVSLTQLAEHLRVAEERFASGLVAYLDVVTAEADLAEAQKELVAAETAVDTAKLRLQTLLRIGLDRDIEVRAGTEVTMPDLSVEEMVRRTVGDVEGVEARADIRAAEEAAKRAKAQAYSPVVDKGLSVDLIGLFDRQTATTLSSGNAWQAGIAVSKQLYDGGSARKQKQQLDELYEVARMEVDRVAWEAARQVATAYAQVQAARKEVDAARQRQLRADESLRVWRLRYENGYAIGKDVLDAQAELTQANAGLVDARYNHQLRIIELRTAMGDWRALIAVAAADEGAGGMSE
jgi:outer membrane protein